MGFKVSSTFLDVCIVGTVVWLTFHYLFGFDPGLVIFLTLLSIEATVSTAVFIRDSSRFEHWLRKAIQTLIHLVEAVRVHLEMLEEILDGIRDIRERMTGMEEKLDRLGRDSACN